MSGTCEFEANILHASRSNVWSETLRRHFTDCESCAAAVSVDPWLQQFSRTTNREHILPDPSIVWLKAQLLRGTADAARISRPITVIQMLAYLVVAGGWAAILTWKWNLIEQLLRRLTPTGIVENAVRAESLSISFFALILILGSTTVMLAIHTILAEE